MALFPLLFEQGARILILHWGPRILQPALWTPAQMNAGEPSAGSQWCQSPQQRCAGLPVTAPVALNSRRASPAPKSAVKTSHHNLKSAMAGVFTPQK